MRLDLGPRLCLTGYAKLVNSSFMGQKPFLYVYGRKEMALLVALGILVALFSFTLGIHLGKRVGILVDPSQPQAHTESAQAGHTAAPTDEGTHAKLQGQDDAVPDRLDLKEQGKNSEKVARASLGEALHAEVARTGIQLETPRQITLPSEAKTPEGGATTDTETAKPEKTVAETPPAEVAKAVEEAAGKFSIQIGSYPTQNLARDHLERLEALGVEPYMVPADVQGKKWFRVYLGKFESAPAARKSAERYRSQRVIESFVIAPIP